jgi:hypothetical protein
MLQLSTGHAVVDGDCTHLAGAARSRRRTVYILSRVCRILLRVCTEMLRSVTCDWATPQTIILLLGGHGVLLDEHTCH